MRLVLFDMDHTLVSCDTGLEWSKFLLKQGLISKEQHQERQGFFLAYQNGALDIDAAYRFEVNVLQQLEPAVRERLLQEYFLSVIKPAISDKAYEQVKKHKIAGNYVVIITATLSEIASLVAEFFEVDHLLATKSKRDLMGNYEGGLEGEACIGRGKLVHLEEWLVASGNNPEHYTFYSDSHNDLPLLEQVDIAIAVDPDDILRSTAIKNGWDIISFHNH